MVKATWIGVAIGASLIVTVLITAVVIIYAPEDGDANDKGVDRPIKWSILSHDMESAPPKPLYQPNDNAECKRVINEHYEMASRTFEYAAKNDAQLNASYQAILDRQEKYGVELATGNKDF